MSLCVSCVSFDVCKTLSKTQLLLLDSLCSCSLDSLSSCSLDSLSKMSTTFHFTKDSPDEQLYSEIGSLNNYELAVLNELAGIIFGFLTQQNQVSFLVN